MVLIENIVLANCRLCHNNPGKHKLTDSATLTSEIYECLRIEINDEFTTALPDSICDECNKAIKEFVSFKQKVQDVNESLHQVLKENTKANHIKKDSLIKVFKCWACPAVFNSETVFNEHIESHNKKKYECSTCKKCYHRQSSLFKHVCHKKLVCPKCNLKFKRVSSLKKHICDNDKIQEGAPTSSIRVQECDQISTSSIGEVERDLNADESKQVLTNLSDLQNCKNEAQHKERSKANNREEIRPYLCVTCGKCFLTKNSLNCHEKIHLKVKGYTCKLCNIGFSVRSNLRAHEKKYHEGVRFYCSQCTRAFITKCSLERHEKIHIGIKEFPCDLCPSAFYTSKELVKHQRYHQGLKLHKCEECFKSFFERHHLIIHLRTHTGERPYVCKVLNCGKSFTESQKLKRHHNAKHAQN